MKLNKQLRRVFCMMSAALIMVTSASAWSVEKQDLTEVEVEFDEGVLQEPSDWAKSEVELALAAGLIPKLTGNPAYTDTITREQFAELIVQSVEVMLDEELEAAPSSTFSDSTNPSVLKASQSGIVNGVGEGKFEPKTTTNREQIATMIFRAIQYVEKDTGKVVAPNAGSLAGFTDKGAVSSWATEGVGTLAANNIMNGTSDTELSPAEACTVEQSILLCYRLYDRFVTA